MKLAAELTARAGTPKKLILALASNFDHLVNFLGPVAKLATVR